jgi:hypothetical protein
MIINIATTHFVNLVKAIFLGSIMRWYDRGFTLDSRRTRQLIQEDYEDINRGSDPETDSKFTNLLVVTGVTFLYSSGMPVLYPIAVIFFLLGYWIDKTLLLRFNRKPPGYDNRLTIGTLWWF